MDNKSKKRIFRLGRGAAVAVAAALILTMGAMAVMRNPGWERAFQLYDEEAQQVLDQRTYVIGQSQKANGWTVTLNECVGDQQRIYMLMELDVPEGVTIYTEEDSTDEVIYWTPDLDCEITEEGSEKVTRGSTYLPVEWNPEERKLTFWVRFKPNQSLSGKEVTLTVGPLTQTVMARWGGETLSEEIVWDGSVVFHDLTLQYPDESIAMELDMQIPYLDGTTTLTRLEISPFWAMARVEGGSCYRHHWVKAEEGYQPEQTERVALEDGTVIEVEAIRNPELDGYRKAYGEMDCFGALEIELHMKDGSVVTTKTTVGSRCQDGFETADPWKAYVGECYVERWVLFGESMINDSDQPQPIIDPAQVDYVTVCGVKIPVAQA